jgi:hypothetical protein
MTFVDVSGNAIGDEGMRTIGDALLSSTTSKLGAIKCDAFDLPIGATSLDLSGKRIGSAAGTLLAGVVKGNASLAEVRLLFQPHWERCSLLVNPVPPPCTHTSDCVLHCLRRSTLMGLPSQSRSSRVLTPSPRSISLASALARHQLL